MTNTRSYSVTLNLTPFFLAWLVMLVVGSLHHNGVNVPAIGYWTSFLYTLAFCVLVYFAKKAVGR